MAEKYGAIFDAMVKKNVAAYDAADADAATELYDEHGVVVNRTDNTSFVGAAQIKNMIGEFIKMGKCEFNMPRKDIHDVGNDRFFVDIDFETKFVDSEVVMKGTSQQLYHKKGDQWKCVYEGFEMH